VVVSKDALAALLRDHARLIKLSERS
jgi:hypothetical protein